MEIYYHIEKLLTTAKPWEPDHVMGQALLLQVPPLSIATPSSLSAAEKKKTKEAEKGKQRKE
jgi:hypothetical protein